jgi:hypothetical protein
MLKRSQKQQQKQYMRSQEKKDKTISFPKITSANGNPPPFDLI